MDFFTAFNQVLVLFILLIVGFVIRKLNIVDDTFSKNLSNFLFTIVYPAMIINSMDFPFSMKALVDGALLITICLGIMAFSGVISVISVKLLKVDILSENVYHFGILFSNFSYMGFPVVSAIYGKEGLFYASIFIVALRLVFYTLGIIIMQRGQDCKTKLTIRGFFNPPIVAVAVGIFFFLFSMKLPKPISMSISMIASIMSPLGMIIIGLILSNMNFNRMFSNYKVYVLSFLRLVLIPLCTFMILRMINIEPLLIGVSVLITAMPVAASVTILAEKYNGNAYLSAQSVFISTMLSIITIPIMALLVMKF